MVAALKEATAASTSGFTSYPLLLLLFAMGAWATPLSLIFMFAARLKSQKATAALLSLIAPAARRFFIPLWVLLLVREAW